MLVGIVVKNAIVLVDYINLMRDRGYELREAIVISGKSRLRPVLMTATTTALGLIPLLVASGTGSEVQRPLATVVVGGLLTSTALTLLVIPALYPWFAAQRHETRSSIKEV